MSKLFLALLVVFFLYSGGYSQNQTVINVRSEIVFAKKAYKIFYSATPDATVSDSIVISDVLGNIEDCFVQRKDDNLIIVYASNGTNKVTHGATLSFEKYILKEGKFKIDNRSVLYYASNINIRSFRYAFFKDRIEFKCKDNPSIAVSYDNIVRFSSMSEFKKAIVNDLIKCECPATL